MTDPTSQIRSILERIEDFTSVFGRVQLRPYQVEAAQAIIDSVIANDGETFVWKFSRQGGKDETLAALYQYIMTILAHRETSIISACPTFVPQTRLAVDRLSDRLGRHLALKRSWKRQVGHIFKVQRARTVFLSAQSHANVVGATAWPLLVMNEAQDIAPAVYDKRFAPMAAANNATRLFCGTAWTRDTLLAREERFCRMKEKQDGRRRVFVVDAAQIASVHPPYGKFLESEVARLGANHPIVVSQYLCREIDSQVGMFPPSRLALMFTGSAIAQVNASESHGPGGPSTDTFPSPHAFLIDVAGMDEALSPLASLERASSVGAGIESARDSTTLSIVEIDLSTLQSLHGPTYRVVQRCTWTGASHLTVFAQLKALAETWNPQHIVVDATGVGEGLWAMLDKHFRTRVIPVKFTQQEKSEIGWRFLSIIETGRFRALAQLSRPQPDASTVSADSVRLQYTCCQSEIVPGPGKILRWGVPDGTRGPEGGLVHDDLILADALVARLDMLEWHPRFEPYIIQAPDPLIAMSRTRKPFDPVLDARPEDREW